MPCFLCQCASASLSVTELPPHGGECASSRRARRGWRLALSQGRCATPPGERVDGDAHGMPSVTRRAVLLLVIALLTCSHVPASWGQPLVQVALVFSFTGAYQNFTLPADVTSVNVSMWGAGGAGHATESGRGGGGAFVSGVLQTTPSETLRVVVGRGGVAYSTSACSPSAALRFDLQCGRPSNVTPHDAWGGGGGCTGGGRTAVQRWNGTNWDDVATAGGGGGAGGFSASGGAATWSGTAWRGNNGARATTFASTACSGGNAGGGGGQTNGGGDSAISLGSGYEPSGTTIQVCSTGWLAYWRIRGTARAGGDVSLGGGGGGWFGGAGGLCNGGGGGSSFTGGFVVGTAWGADASTFNAGGATHPRYASGIGVGGTTGNLVSGGHGRCVIIYNTTGTAASTSVTASVTASPSVSRSITASESVYPSESASASGSTSVSPSVSGSTSVSPSMSRTCSETASASRTASVTASSSLTPSLTPSVSPSPAPGAQLLAAAVQLTESDCSSVELCASGIVTLVVTGTRLSAVCEAGVVNTSWTRAPVLSMTSCSANALAVRMNAFGEPSIFSGMLPT